MELEGMVNPESVSVFDAIVAYKVELGLKPTLYEELGGRLTMWDAVTPVDKNYDPIIYEGPSPATAIILNTGPGTINLLAWNTPRAEGQPLHIEMRPANTRSIRGHLVRCQLAGGDFAAIAWRILA